MAAVLAATLVVGAAVQGLVGLGIGLVAAPVASLIQPQLMPDLLLWLALLLPVVTLLHEHHQVDWRGLAWAVPARVPGTAVGVVFVSWFSAREIGIAVGIMVLVSVLATGTAVRLPVHAGTLVAAGLISGVTGTTTSIGGPPIAILYQHRSPAQIRSTLAIYFLLGAGFSLVGLGITGALERSTFVLAMLMVPCLFLGFGLSRLLNRVVAAHHIRGGVLLVCGLSALVLLVKSLFG
ncbi:MAG TPA: sulfite exporter TauE/SafE family protein [Nocardioidaceae bacterium]|nr:sulfite exporter TauE/SafE family protein [Nocardioidaceae bacterium]